MSRLRVLVVGAGVGGISVARGLLRDGHDVTLFERRPEVMAGGGAVTIWSSGSTVLRQLGVEMEGSGQLMSVVRLMTSTGRLVTTYDFTAMADRLGAPIRMVPRRVLLERLLEGFPPDRIRYNSRAVRAVSMQTGAQVELADGTSADGDLVIGADGTHSVVRTIVGGQQAEPTGWCSWQGLLAVPAMADVQVGQTIVGKQASLSLWPAGNSDLQWSFDMPWSYDFVRPDRPIDFIRSHFAGWSESVDRVLAALTDDDLAQSPYPHLRHPIPRAYGRGAITLLGDAAHTMPPSLGQGANQALLDTMVLCQALSDFRTVTDSDNGAVSRALRWYESTRRRKVKAASWGASLQVAQSEAQLRPVAMIPDGFMTWLLTMFLRSVSHDRMSIGISNARHDRRGDLV